MTGGEIVLVSEPYGRGKIYRLIVLPQSRSDVLLQLCWSQRVTPVGDATAP